MEPPAAAFGHTGVGVPGREVTAVHAFRRWCRVQPDKTLYTWLDHDGKEQKAWSYRDAERRADAVAKALLSDWKCKPGDRVVLSVTDGRLRARLRDLGLSEQQYNQAGAPVNLLLAVLADHGLGQQLERAHRGYKGFTDRLELETDRWLLLNEGDHWTAMCRTVDGWARHDSGTAECMTQQEASEYLQQFAGLLGHWVIPLQKVDQAAARTYDGPAMSGHGKAGPTGGVLGWLEAWFAPSCRRLRSQLTEGWWGARQIRQHSLLHTCSAGEPQLAIVLLLGLTVVNATPTLVTANTALVQSSSAYSARLEAWQHTLQSFPDSGVLCFQEIWSGRDIDTFNRTLATRFPYSLSLAGLDSFDGPPCHMSIVQPLMSCLWAHGCNSDDLDDWAICVAGPCSTEWAILRGLDEIPSDCVFCASYMVAQRSLLAGAAVRRCSEPSLTAQDAANYRNPGLLLMSSSPLGNAEHTRLPSQVLPRGSIYAETRLDQTPVGVTCTHLVTDVWLYPNSTGNWGLMNLQGAATISSNAGAKTVSKQFIIGDLNFSPRSVYRGHIDGTFEATAEYLASKGWVDLYENGSCTFCRPNTVVKFRQDLPESALGHVPRVAYMLDHIMYRGPDALNVSSRRLLLNASCLEIEEKTTTFGANRVSITTHISDHFGIAAHFLSLNASSNMSTIEGDVPTYAPCGVRSETWYLISLVASSVLLSVLAVLIVGIICEYCRCLGSVVPSSSAPGKEPEQNTVKTRNCLAEVYSADAVENEVHTVNVQLKGAPSFSTDPLPADSIDGQSPVLSVGFEQLIQQKLSDIVGYQVERFTPLAEAGLSTAHVAELERELSLSVGALLIHQTVAEIALHLATRSSDECGGSPRSVKHKGSVNVFRGVLASAFGVVDELCIQWDRLSVCFKDRTGLYPMSGQIAPKEVVAVMGGSGSGKTTFLKSLAGYPLPRGCSVSGVVSTGDKVLRCPLIQTPLAAFVPQFGCFFDELTLSETMLFALAVNPLTMSLPAVGRAEMVASALEALGLTHRVNSSISTLSGGEVKRAQLCDALLTGARLLLLDEPTSGLSAREALEFMHLCKAVSQAGICSVLMSLHQPCQRSFASLTRVLGLCNGSLVFCGTPQSVEPHLESISFADDAGNDAGRSVAELFSEWLLEAEPQEHAGVDTSRVAVATTVGQNLLLYTLQGVDSITMWRQLTALVLRGAVVRTRQFTTYVTIGIVWGQALFFGCFFYDLRRSASSTLDWLAVCYVVMQAFCQQMVAFAIQGSLFQTKLMHELANGKYSSTLVVVAELSVDSARNLVVGAIYAYVTAALIGFRSLSPTAVSLYTLVLWLDSLVFGVLYTWIACVYTSKAACGLVPALLFVAGTTSGFQRNIGSSLFVRTLSYVSPQYYCLEALVNLEMEGQVYSCRTFAEQTTVACPTLGNDFLHQRDFRVGYKWQNAAVLVAFVFSFVVLWKISLSRRGT